MKKDFTDEQFDLANKLILSAMRKENAENSMIKGIFKPRKVSNPEAEREIVEESKYIYSTLDTLPNDEKFDMLDCVSKLGHYYSRMSALESFEKGPLNHYSYFVRGCIVVHETYYDSKLDILLEKLKSSKEYGARHSAICHIRDTYHNMDKRDQKYLMGRLSHRKDKSNRELAKPMSYEQLKNANDDLSTYQTFESIANKEQAREA